MSLPTNPYPLGKLTPGGTVSVQVISNLIAAGYFKPDPRDAFAKDLLIQASSANTQSLFVTTDARAPQADYSNVLRELPPGSFYTIGTSVGVNTVDTRNYYLYAQNATDFGFGEVREG